MPIDLLFNLLYMQIIHINTGITVHQRFFSVFPQLLEAASDKRGWGVKASSTYNPQLPATLVIDGKRDDTGQNFATGGNQPHSWLQIDMGEQKWVKGGRMVPLYWQRQYYTEVVKFVSNYIHKRYQA